jgi:histidinol-phosphatase
LWSPDLLVAVSVAALETVGGGRVRDQKPAVLTDRLSEDGAVSYDDDLALALELANLAATLSLKRSGAQDLRVEQKPDGSVVTEVDRQIEQALRTKLVQSRPDDKVVGEEFGGSAGQGGRCWYLDPIDGTTSFIDGTQRWSTLIALTVDGAVVLGVADFPAQDRRYWAAKGQGAFLNGQRLAVSAATSLAQATVCDDYRHHIEQGTPDHPLVRLARRCRSVRPHSDHSMLIVARGLADAAVGFDGGPWDYAPFVIIVAEAGGRTTDREGRSRFDTGSLLATNGHLHDEALAVL